MRSVPLAVALGLDVRSAGGPLGGFANQSLRSESDTEICFAVARANSTFPQAFATREKGRIPSQ
jgi:hypothetical protein